MKIISVAVECTCCQQTIATSLMKPEKSLRNGNKAIYAEVLRQSFSKEGPIQVVRIEYESEPNVQDAEDQPNRGDLGQCDATPASRTGRLRGLAAFRFLRSPVGFTFGSFNRDRRSVIRRGGFQGEGN